jgi:hypothetical protein
MARELRRVLRPDGTLVLSTPNERFSDGTNPYHLHEFTRPKLEETLAAAGFSVVRWFGQGWWPLRSLSNPIVGLRRLAWEAEGRAKVIPIVKRMEPIILCLVAKPLSLAGIG